MVRSHPILERKLSSSSSTSSNSTPFDTDRYERFTAAGRPMPAAAHNRGGAGVRGELQVRSRSVGPLFLCLITMHCQSIGVGGWTSANGSSTPQKRRRSLRDRLLLRTKKTKAVVAMMPRREYLRHFAHDEAGRYIGTEKQESWSEGDLEEEFGEYRMMEPRQWVVRNSGGMAYMEEE
ncbi:hypothetical protein V492_00104 [Pseudogymnoascus sp. VKM F-4246]|nr:hypothetical protein V492_00104 [Pseudogymnoascus sp. VKM F-4246]